MRAVAAGADAGKAWPPPIAPRLRPVLLRAAAEAAAKPPDNLAGGIGWGVSYVLDALVEMYRATGDDGYLEAYVPLADTVIAARADRRGERDWKGEFRRAWLTAGPYTLGMPYRLLDREGRPSLEIRTVARGGNDATTVAASPAPDGRTFTLTVVRAFRGAPVTRTFPGLTPANAEARVNAPPGQEAYLRVRRLGDAVPRAYPPFTPPVGKVALNVHTARAVSPLAQFAASVAGRPGLERFAAPAARCRRAAEESYADMSRDWREAGDYGYFVFAKGIPFWADGAPEPLNMQAAAGTACLNLWDATGKKGYRERAEKIARLIRREAAPQPDGTFLYDYWWGVVHRGWTPAQGVSANTPRYPGGSHPEDLSHLQLSLRFLAECYGRGIVFPRADLERWAATFHRRLYRPTADGAGTLAGNVAGEEARPVGRYDGSVAGLALLGDVDPTVTKACRALFEARQTPIAARPVTLYGWSVLARMEAQQGERKTSGVTRPC